ncbi:MAG: hypothetical protein FWC96_01670 [Oscillospiraceae bacterium]|nr:hypothetical protein [Oscillospiraceae bacterium]
MTKNTRLFLSVVFAVLAVAFVVFIIQTLLLNRARDDTDPSVTVAGVYNGYEGEYPPAGDDASVDTADATVPEAGEAATPARSPEPPNTWIPLLDDNYMTLFVPEGVFTQHETDTGAMFTGLDGATLEISLVPVGDNIEIFARGFLIPFLDFTDFLTEGLINIASSDVAGYFVMVYNHDEAYEAWIHDLGDGFGVAVIINYINYTQRDALYDLLDTLTIDN